MQHDTNTACQTLLEKSVDTILVFDTLKQRDLYLIWKQLKILEIQQKITRNTVTKLTK